MRSYKRVLSAGMLLLGVSCGGGGAGVDAGPCPAFPADPLETVTSQTGSYQITIRTLPQQPPPRGVDTVQYAIANDAGQAVSGLSLSVLPWMPAMAHGNSVNPTLTDCGGGQYTLGNVDFYMPGTWELQTTLQANVSGSVPDHANPQFQIP